MTRAADILIPLLPPSLHKEDYRDIYEKRRNIIYVDRFCSTDGLKIAPYEVMVQLSPDPLATCVRATASSSSWRGLYCDEQPVPTFD
jgi:hypothetical protein